MKEEATERRSDEGVVERVVEVVVKVIVNGAEEQVPAGMTVRGLVEGKGMSAEKVAVEVNRRLVRSAGGGYERVLAEGDVVEIVTFVGGG